MSINIISFNFNNKTLTEKAFKIRETVFIKEQNVPKDMEYDEFDEKAIQFLIFNNEIPVGTSRYRTTTKGIKLERFAILKEHRKKGFASQLLKFMLEKVNGKNQKIYLFAQINAVNFYKKHNFTIIDDEFIETGIVHYEMDYVKPE
ncbi:MAG: GNAT family N-acetyltransferase [Bacteroidales bacterium]|nr:GNAT family N-acetyltransferase [Bacteroidales bacterium]MBN2756805.1 GNAT family N-acetyltransferase [Bacteroidales bacterium]